MHSNNSKKSKNSAHLYSASFYDTVPSNADSSSFCTYSQTSQNMSTQTNFKSTTSVSLKSHAKVEVYRERCTQTSKTVITLTAEESPRFSPDSLSPKREIRTVDEAGDVIERDLNSLSLADLDYLPFERRNSLMQYLSQYESTDLFTGSSLTKNFLTKNRDKLPSSTWIPDSSQNSNPDSLRSQSCVVNNPKQDLMRFKVKNVKSKVNSGRKSPVDKNKRSLSFMSPTISSESKDQSLEIESIQKLISPTRKGRSNSPKVNYSADVHKQMKKVPYIDASTANLRLCAPKHCNHEENLTLNLKPSTEDFTSTVDTGTSTTSTECALSQAISKLRDKDWNTALRGLAEIVEILKLLDDDQVFPHMTVINQRLIELIKSPRSHVCRTACQAIGHIFEYVKDTRRPEFDILVDTLLCKTADSNKFIRQDANLALDCMVTHIPTFHAVRTICSKGPDHKNVLVRTAAARLLVCSVVIAGPQSILHPHSNEYTRRRIILNMVKFMEDRCLEIRKYGERLYRLLYKDRIFEIYLRRYLEPEIIKKIKLCLKHVNGQKI